MSAATMILDIDQGEDYTAQLTVTDYWGQPLGLVYPIRMDIKGDQVSPILSLITPSTEPTDGSIPPITFSPDIGLIQVHITRGQTAALPAGTYTYDMFVTVDDQGSYAGVQQFKLLSGTVLVNDRVTVM